MKRAVQAYELYAAALRQQAFDLAAAVPGMPVAASDPGKQYTVTSLLVIVLFWCRSLIFQTHFPPNLRAVRLPFLA